MDRGGPESDGGEAGPRAILRVPDVLLALAVKREGTSLAELSAALKVPKTSLLRLLRTLERGAYVTNAAGVYRLGPTSFQLASAIGQAAEGITFPACARPVIEWLARETGESVMLGVLSDDGSEIIYVDVVDSAAPLRFTVPLGNRRPLYSAASGKAVLAFLPAAVQQAYMEQTNFQPFTRYTTRREELPGILRNLRERGVTLDCNGSFEGAGAIASPVFDRNGDIFCAVSIAGPLERVELNCKRSELLVREAGERISRMLGYGREYPPT